MARFFTICARNYLAHAAVLGESLAAHVPGARLTVVLLDGEEQDLPAAPIDFVSARALPFADPGDFHQMAMMYEVMELATALKPWAFRYLLRDSSEPVVFLDPDIQFFSAPHGIDRLALEHGIVLTPHSLKPIPDDGREPGERALLLSGSFNLGFLAVASSAGDFLDWWSGRLRTDCIVEPSSGLFVDQKWIDLVPSYFDHAIVRNPGWNVAYWNIGVRTLTREGSQYSVDGVPLCFFHFSGFDPRHPHLLSRHTINSPRALLSESSDLAALCTGYAEALIRHGYEERSATPYLFDLLPGGLRIDRRMRRLYREEVMRAGPREALGVLPDPFDPDGERLVEWLRDPVIPGGVSRYQLEVYRERADLQSAFPEVRDGDGSRYLDWLNGGGVVDPPIPADLMRGLPSKASITVAGSSTPGVNLHGYVPAESGTGQIARSILAALNEAGIPHSVIPFAQSVNRAEYPVQLSGSGSPEFDTNIICVNADQLPLFAQQKGWAMEGRYNIGVWAWEIEDFPETLAAHERYVDEIWGISSFTARAIRNKVSRPVRDFPLPVLAATPSSRSRTELGLPAGFLFFFCFDFNSIVQRKNPGGLIAAFRAAFPREGEAWLYIKTVNGHRHVGELERLRVQIRDRRDIMVVDGYRSVEDQAAMLAASDAYVSLHRAEGFGLTIAEAMAAGKPVVATAYSAPLEFMTDGNAFMVPAGLSKVGAGASPYPPDAFWAEPDLEWAARSMRRLFDDREEGLRRGTQAARDMALLHNAKGAAKRLHTLLEESRRARSVRGSAVPALSQRAGAVAIERAASLLHGPDPDSPSSVPWLARPFRRLMLRVIRNYSVHQLKLDRQLLHAIHDTATACSRAAAAQDAALAELRSELHSLREQVRREKR